MTTKALFAACASVNAVSFFLPLQWTPDDYNPGMVAFVMAMIFPLGWPAWAANPLFWLALARLGEGRRAAARSLGFAAAVLGFGGVALLRAMFEQPLWTLGPAFWVWIGSIAAFPYLIPFCEPDPRPAAYPVGRSGALGPRLRPGPP